MEDDQLSSKKKKTEIEGVTEKNYKNKKTEQLTE